MVKYLLILTLLLTGCGTKDPRCMDGYLVAPINSGKNHWVAFCKNAYRSEHGLHGSGCYDLPGWSKGAKGNLVIREGTISKTECYNTTGEK